MGVRDEAPVIGQTRRGSLMDGSVYRVTEVIGTSSDSREAAARNAVETAAGSVRDLCARRSSGRTSRSRMGR